MGCDTDRITDRRVWLGDRLAHDVDPAMEIDGMTLVYGTYIGNQTNTELVAAQSGKIIRVVRLVVTCWSGVKVTLVSDPGGDPANLTPPLHLGAGQSLVLQLGRGLAVATGRGKALGLSTVFQVAGAEFSVAVWYDVVT